MNESTSTINEYETAIARQKSYIGASIVTFVLYLVFYIPGLVANILYYRDSRRIEALVNKKPSGQIVLLILLAWGFVPLFFTCLGIAILLGFDVVTYVLPHTYTLF